MTDLRGLGYEVSLGFGINATGEAVGRSYRAQTVPTAGCPRHTCVAHPADPVSWIAGSMTDLGTLGGTFSEARAVNRNGDIAGGSNSDAFLVHSGKMSNLARARRWASMTSARSRALDAAALAPVSSRTSSGRSDEEDHLAAIRLARRRHESPGGVALPTTPGWPRSWVSRSTAPTSCWAGR